MPKSDDSTQKRIPTMEELPYSDGKPLDGELQAVIPHLLRDVLYLIWKNRHDWFFGVNMGWYYDPYQDAIAPNGFLCLGVSRVKGNNLRLSYVTWEENWVIPSLALEVVLKTSAEKYREKIEKYAEHEVLYFVEYAPMQGKKQKLNLYRLNSEGRYELQDDNPLWMPEIGLGIGTEVGSDRGITREWLYWYDGQGKRYPTPEEAERQAQLQRRYAERRQRQERQARQQAEERQDRAEREAQRERERAEQLAARLRELGIDPDRLN